MYQVYQKDQDQISGASYISEVVFVTMPKYFIKPYNAIFLKSLGSKDIKNDILDCQIHKYKDKNTQIHCDEVPEIPNMCYIFEKPGVQGHQK